MIYFMPHWASCSCFRFLGLPFSIAYYQALLPLTWPLAPVSNLFHPSSKCNYLQARELQHSNVSNNFRAIKACSCSRFQCKDQAVIRHNAQLCRTPPATQDGSFSRQSESYIFYAQNINSHIFFLKSYRPTGHIRCSRTSTGWFLCPSEPCWTFGKSIHLFFLTKAS